MKNPQKNDCENIVELLTKDYFAKYRSELDRKISSMAGFGFDSRMSNVSKQLHAHFEYLDGLVDYVIGSLKKDFGHIPLGGCKDKLVAILDTEYKKLIPKANSLLVKASLANQASLDNFQKRIFDELEKAKEKVEIQFAITEKQKAASKGPGDNEKASRIGLKTAWIKLAATIIGLIGAILTSPYWGSWLYKMLSGYVSGTKTSTTSETSGDSSPAIITSGPNSSVTVNYGSPKSSIPSDANNIFGKTLLYENLRTIVSTLEHQIINEKIEPWNFFNTNKGMEVTKYDGKVISYKEIKFEGSPRFIFWNGFVEPFLENGIAQVLNTVAQECKDRKIDRKEFLQEANSLLRSLISKTYQRMAEIDRNLRGKGYPEKVTPEDVSDKIEKMQNFLDQYTKAILNDTKPPQKSSD